MLCIVIRITCCINDKWFDHEKTYLCQVVNNDDTDQPADPCVKGNCYIIGKQPVQQCSLTTALLLTQTNYGTKGSFWRQAGDLAPLHDYSWRFNAARFPFLSFALKVTTASYKTLKMSNKLNINYWRWVCDSKSHNLLSQISDYRKR